MESLSEVEKLKLEIDILKEQMKKQKEGFETMIKQIQGNF